MYRMEMVGVYGGDGVGGNAEGVLDSVGTWSGNVVWIRSDCV